MCYECFNGLYINQLTTNIRPKTLPGARGAIANIGRLIAELRIELLHGAEAPWMPLDEAGQPGWFYHFKKEVLLGNLEILGGTDYVT